MTFKWKPPSCTYCPFKVSKCTTIEGQLETFGQSTLGVPALFWLLTLSYSCEYNINKTTQDHMWNKENKSNAQGYSLSTRSSSTILQSYYEIFQEKTEM